MYLSVKTTHKPTFLGLLYLFSSSIVSTWEISALVEYILIRLSPVSSVTSIIKVLSLTEIRRPFLYRKQMIIKLCDYHDYFFFMIFYHIFSLNTMMFALKSLPLSDQCIAKAAIYMLLKCPPGSMSLTYPSMNKYYNLRQTTSFKFTLFRENAPVVLSLTLIIPCCVIKSAILVMQVMVCCQIGTHALSHALSHWFIILHRLTVYWVQMTNDTQWISTHQIEPGVINFYYYKDSSF